MLFLLLKHNIMAKYFFLGLFFISTIMSSQNSLNSVFPWTVGAGVNIVDNDGRQFKDIFSTKNWNFGNPISLNIENKISNYFAGNFAITFNKFTPKKEQNYVNLEKSHTFFAMDATIKYFYDEYFMPNQRFDPFEAYLVGGLGFTTISITSTASFDFGLGFNFWFLRDFGLRLQTLGKFGFKDQEYLYNYMQHTAEIIYRF